MLSGRFDRSCLSVVTGPVAGAAWSDAANSPMKPGRSCNPCCQPREGSAAEVGGGPTIARSSTTSCGGCGPACLGATSPSVTGRGRPATTGFAAGGATAPGTGCWPTCNPLRRGRRGGLRDQHRLHHQPRPPARRWRLEAASQGGPKRVAHPPREALGRSRGGLTTKLHLGCEGRGRPMSIVVTEGQRHDGTQLEAVLDGIRVPRPGGRGRPRKRPDHVLADKGYSYGDAGRCCANVASATPSPNARIRRPAARVGRPRSTVSGTSAATWWSAASTSSSTGGRSLAGSTSVRSTTALGSCWPPSCWPL
jgi:hypothetical protein